MDDWIIIYTTDHGEMLGEHAIWEKQRFFEGSAQYQEIISCLEEAGQNMDDWIIIYTTDHGEMLGEHAIWEKQRFFEGSARIPLMIRYPNRISSSRCDKNVNLIDLFPTLCDLCGLEIPDNLDGRSLLPLLNKDEMSWENVTYSQYRENYVMIKKDDLKYQWYGDDQSEILFDLKRNPSETENYIENVTYSQYRENYVMIKKDDLKYQWYGDDQSEILFDLKRNPSETENYIDQEVYKEDVLFFRKQRDHYMKEEWEMCHSIEQLS